MNHRIVAVIGLLLLLNACMVGPKYQRPSAPMPLAYKEPPPPGWKQAQPNDGAMRGKWWEIYKDPALNALEEEVNISNQNVRAAEAQYRQAKAAVRIARAGLFPTLTTAPSITGSQSAAGIGANSGVRGTYSLPFDVGYQADVWGSIHRGIAANTDIAQASAAQLANARLLFQTQLAADYFQLRGNDSDRQLLTDAVKSYQEYLELTRNRFEGGVASMADVALAETQLETTSAQLVDLGVQRAQLEHAIAILAGKPPANLSIPQSPLSGEPPVIPLSVPTVILERRPDIAAAERQVGAANEQIGIAMAALYPSLAISASAGLQSSSFLDWFTWPSRFWSVGPQLAQTLFDAGRRRGQITLSEAAYDVTVANYRQTVLTAFQQVEDNLAALRILAEESDVQARAVKSAAQSLNLSTIQYQGGVVSYLQVIASQTVALQDQRTANDILTRRLTASVFLIEALGGGWDASQLPTAQELIGGK